MAPYTDAEINAYKGRACTFVEKGEGRLVFRRKDTGGFFAVEDEKGELALGKVVSEVSKYARVQLRGYSPLTAVGRRRADGVAVRLPATAAAAASAAPAAAAASRRQQQRRRCGRRR